MGVDERGPSSQGPYSLYVGWSTEAKGLHGPIIVFQLYSIVVKRGSLIKGFMVE